MQPDVMSAKEQLEPLQEREQRRMTAAIHYWPERRNFVETLYNLVFSRQEWHRLQRHISKAVALCHRFSFYYADKPAQPHLDIVDMGIVSLVLVMKMDETYYEEAMIDLPNYWWMAEKMSKYFWCGRCNTANEYCRQRFMRETLKRLSSIEFTMCKVLEWNLQVPNLHEFVDVHLLAPWSSVEVVLDKDEDDEHVSGETIVLLQHACMYVCMVVLQAECIVLGRPRELSLQQRRLATSLQERHVAGDWRGVVTLASEALALARDVRGVDDPVASG